MCGLAVFAGALLHVHRQTPTVGQAAEQEFVGQGLADGVLDEALHGACAHERIEAFFGQVFAQRVGEGDLDFFLGQLAFELQQELVDHAHDDVFVQRFEADGGVQAVAELGREQALDVGHLVARFARVGEADGGLVHGLGARVGGHDHDHVAEVGLAPVVVGQRAVVHDLQQHVVNVRMGFFDLVEQEHAVRLLGDGLGEQAPLVKAHIARRRTDQAADRVALHVLGHVKAHQVDAHDVGQLLGRFGFAHTGGAAEQESANGLVGLAQTGARHLDRGRQNFEGFVLTEDHALQVALERLQLAAVVVGHVGRGDAGDLGHDLFDLGFADGFLALGRGQDALGRTGLVDHINGLVGQVAVVDVLGREFGRGLQRAQGVFHAVVLFKARLQAFEDVHGFLHRGLEHIDFLEAARERGVFFENAAVLGEGGGTDALELPAGERGLEQVGCIERAAGSRTSPNEGVDLVDEQDRMGSALQGLDDAFQALLEVAAVFGAGQQCAHVQRIHDGFAQNVGHFVLGDAPSQALGDGGFAHAGLAHQERVVFAAAAQDLDGALHLELTTNERVDLAVLGHLVEVLRVLLQRRGFFIAFGVGVAALFGFWVAFGRLAGFGWIALADAVGNEVHHVQARDALLVEVVHRV